MEEKRNRAPEAPAPVVEPNGGKPEDDMEVDAAGNTILRYRGQVFRLSPLEQEDFDEVEAHLMRNRQGPIEAIKDFLKDAPAEIQRELLDRAYRDLRKTAVENKIPPHEVIAWLQTFDGIAFSMHMQLVREHPELTLAAVRKMLSDIGVARGRRMLDRSAKKLAAEAGVQVGE